MEVKAPETQSFSVRNYDPDRLREVINGADLEHTILDPKNCDATIHQWKSPDISIDHGFYSFPVFVSGQFAPGNLCIGLSLGRSEATWVNGATLDDASIQIYAEDSEMIYRAGSDTDWGAITVTREFLQNHSLKYFDREIDLPTSGMKNYRSTKRLVRRLYDAVSAMHRRSWLTPDQVESGIESGIESFLRVLLECVITAGEADFAKRIESRQSLRMDLVKRADAVIRQSIVETEGYSSELICRKLGVSERSLQMNFKEAMGMSPRDWFRQVAMRQARFALEHSQPKPGIIAHVAMNHHFGHLGRFSQEYKKLFGESPSMTVQRASTAA